MTAVELGERVEKLRKERGLKRSEVAIAVGLTRQGLWAIEKGKNGTTLKRLEKISAVLGVSSSELMEKEHDTK